MRRNSHEIVIWNQVTPKGIASSTDATPIVVTCVAHGFATGDLVMITGHTTNIAANGIFRITRLTSSTFSLQDYNTGADVVGSGAGAGSSGILLPAPKILSVADYRNIVLYFEGTNSPDYTLFITGSIGKMTPNSHGDTPNFGATASVSNPYTNLQLINLSTGGAVSGATGVVASGTDLSAAYEVNINGMKYICPMLTAYSDGAITLKAQLSDNL